MAAPNLTGASYPLKISGKEFEASAFSERDYDEIDLYIQSKIIEVAKRNLDSLYPSERTQFLQAAIKAAASSGWGTEEGNRIMLTVEGALRLGWQLVKKTGISWEDFHELGRKEDQLTNNLLNIDIAYGKLNFSNNGEDGEDSPDDSKRISN
jgi:hypothetical protein